MTDRRPHWTDDLIGSVIGEIGVLRPSPPPLANTAYAVIAAVEDWQVQHARGKVLMVAGDPGTYVGGLEAAIQRVRELHQPHRCRMSTRHTVCRPMHGGGCASVGKCDVCRTEYPCATIRALDGEQ